MRVEHSEHPRVDDCRVDLSTPSSEADSPECFKVSDCMHRVAAVPVTPGPMVARLAGPCAPRAAGQRGRAGGRAGRGRRRAGAAGGAAGRPRPRRRRAGGHTRWHRLPATRRRQPFQSRLSLTPCELQAAVLQPGLPYCRRQPARTGGCWRDASVRGHSEWSDMMQHAKSCTASQPALAGHAPGPASRRELEVTALHLGRHLLVHQRLPPLVVHV